MWEIVKTSSVVTDYYRFLDEYPNSRFSGAAKLKIQQLKRKQNAQTMTASIAPNVKDQNAPDNQKATQNKYRLAIFPTHIYTTTGGEFFIAPTEIANIKGVSSVVLDDNRLSLKYCYKEIKGITDGVTLLNDISKSDVWKRKSIFSNMEPNWEEVRKIALELNANLVVMVSGRIVDRKYIFYLYDPENDKVYSKHANSRFGTWEGTVQVVMPDLLEEFFN